MHEQRVADLENRQRQHGCLQKRSADRYGKSEFATPHFSAFFRVGL